MEKLWPGCINSAVSHHFRTIVAMGAQGMGHSPSPKSQPCSAKDRPGARQRQNGWRRQAGGQPSIGVASMCDYSLHHVASRPARVGDKLVSTSFVNSGTRGFAAVGEPNVAVCLLAGTELAFEEDLQCEAAYGFGFKRLS